MLIRFANKEDYEEVEEIAEQVQKMHVEWRPDIYTFEKKVFPDELFEQIIENNLLIVADDDEKVVGFLMYIVNKVDFDNQVERTVYRVDAVAVDEEYRGQGIGHKLFDYLKDIAKDNKIDAIELQVNSENKAAKAMYEKYGFTDKSINMELKL